MKRAVSAARGRGRSGALTPRKPAAKTARLGDSPLTLRLPLDLIGRIDDLQPLIAADSDTAALLGGVSRSSVLRLVMVEGLRVLEQRYRGEGEP